MAATHKNTFSDLWRPVELLLRTETVGAELARALYGGLKW
jgi:hypothetical protein